LVEKNIVYIVSNFPCYSETFILNELVELKKRGYKIFIFSLKKPKEKIIQNEAKEFLKDTFYSPFLLGINLWKAQIYFLRKRPSFYLKIIFEIIIYCIKKPLILLKNLSIFPKSIYFAYYIKEKNINHIHAHFANYPTTCAMIISQILNIPFSFTCHAHDIFYDTTMLDLKIKKAKLCFAISEYNRNYILRIYPTLTKEKIKVLHCGIDLDKFSFQREKKSEKKLNILSIGRFMPTKGFDDLIFACKILKDKNIDFTCKIIGEGPLEKKLKKLIKDLKLEKEVIINGPLTQKELIEEYKKADIFVLASKRAKHPDVQDGIPLVLMEAMAEGVIVISTKLSGIPELIEDRKNGILINPDDELGLAKAINEIYLADKESIELLKEKAREKIYREFNICNSINELEESITKN